MSALEQPLTIEVDKDSEKILRRLERKYPRHYKRAFGWAVHGAVLQLRKGVKSGGGMYGIETFTPKTDFTKQMEGIEKQRKKNAKKNGAKFRKNYGWYGTIGSGVMTRWRDSALVQHIGWPTAIGEWVSEKSAQEAEQHEFDPRVRSAMRHQGAKNIPSFYNRPKRMVIEPFAAFQKAGEFAKNVAGSVKKLMEDEAKKK